MVDKIFMRSSYSRLLNINPNILSVILQMILSFELPFALIPLLKFTSSKTKMGSHANPVAVRDLLAYLIFAYYCCTNENTGVSCVKN